MTAAEQAGAPEPDWLRDLGRRAQESAFGKRLLPEAGPDPRSSPPARRSGTSRAPRGFRASAVLMLFGPAADGGQDIVLTERSATLRHHAGQVSFPGGGVEAGDATVVDTALREAHEEIGLRPEGVRITGELPVLPLSVTGFRVTPVVAWWEEPSPIGVVDPAEVARVERVALADLVDPAHRFSSVHPARSFDAPAFEVDGLYIWGFTAIILDATLRLAGLERPWDVGDRRLVPERYWRGG